MSGPVRRPPGSARFLGGPVVATALRSYHRLHRRQAFGLREAEGIDPAACGRDGLRMTEFEWGIPFVPLFRRKFSSGRRSLQDGGPSPGGGRLSRRCPPSHEGGCMSCGQKGAGMLSGPLRMCVPLLLSG